MQRSLSQQLEEARLTLARRLEREVVEERMLQQFAKHVEMQGMATMLAVKEVPR